MIGIESRPRAAMVTQSHDEANDEEKALPQTDPEAAGVKEAEISDVTDRERIIDQGPAGDNTSRSGTKRLTTRLKRVEYICTPKWCRWDPDNPPKFTWSMCALFSFVRVSRGAAFKPKKLPTHICLADCSIQRRQSLLQPPHPQRESRLHEMSNSTANN